MCFTHDFPAGFMLHVELFWQTSFWTHLVHECSHRSIRYSNPDSNSMCSHKSIEDTHLERVNIVWCTISGIMVRLLTLPFQHSESWPRILLWHCRIFLLSVQQISSVVRNFMISVVLFYMYLFYCHFDNIGTELLKHIHPQLEVMIHAA